jgi:hypothetical protein
VVLTVAAPEIEEGQSCLARVAGLPQRFRSQEGLQVIA